LQRFQQLHPDPDLGPLKHDHKLTLIFFSLYEGLFTNRWMKRGDPDVIWPRDWLPKEKEGLGDNILVLYFQGFVSRGKESWVNMGNDLVQSLVMKYVCSHRNALLGSFLGVFAS
jgi:hypothetical protein